MQSKLRRKKLLSPEQEPQSLLPRANLTPVAQHQLRKGVLSVGGICEMEESHREAKNKVKSINKRSTFNSILEDSMLSESEKEMMKLYYIDQKSFDFIADELGYSKAGILKMHKRALKKIESLI